MNQRDRDTLYDLLRTNGAAIVADLAVRACYDGLNGSRVQDRWEQFLDHTGWCDEVRGEHEQVPLPDLHIIP